MSVRPFGKYNDEHDGVSMIILIFNSYPIWCGLALNLVNNIIC